MDDRRVAMKTALKRGGVFDFNTLELANQHVALSLVEAREAKFKIVDGRTKVVNMSPRWWMVFLTMGGHA